MGFMDNMRQQGAGDGTSSDPAEAAVPQSGDGKKRRKRRKPEEMLASVVRETTVNAAVDLLRQNAPFALPGNNSWAALALPVANIGGLSKKQQKDEAKGSLIELINHDLIQAVTTRLLLDEEVLGIIPTPQTLERMEEYSLLTNATYFWMVLSPNQDGTDLVVNPVNDKTASYADAVAVANGSRPLSEFLPHVWAWTSVIDTPAAPQSPPNPAANPTPSPSPYSPSPSAYAPPASPEPTEAAPVYHGTPAPVGRSPFPDAEPPEDDEGAAAPDGDISAGSEGSLMFSEETDDVLDENQASDRDDFEDDALNAFDGFEEEYEEAHGTAEETEAEPGGDSAIWEEYAEHNRDREFTEDEVRETIARRFLSSDLDLAVALDEFEATFDTEAPTVLLELDHNVADKPTDWLGEQVHQLARQANAELAKLHRNHREELRKLFVETMGLHAESVMREVDEHREGAVYQRLAAAAEQEFRELKTRAAEDISAQRAEISRRYEADADSRAEVAAAQARQVFWDRSRPEFERRIADVALEVERRNEERYTQRRQLVLEMRRRDAHTRMQLGTTRAFQLLAEREAVQRATEMDLLERWNTKLTRYIDENRKQDIARADALAAQLQLDNSIERIQSANTQRTTELKAEHEAQIRRLRSELNAVTAELERTREKAEARMLEREREWQHKAETNNQMYSGLAERTRGLTDTMHQEYTNQLMAVNRANQASIEELNRANQVQRRANKILFVLMAVFALAAIGVGVIVGWWISYNTFGGSAMVLPIWFD
ncbi:hypothetical protein ABZ635_04275 [Nocardiopsis sp. NPDC007018]|uniref:hypothetical protein n=1 Tax=Nocardiopsis sp. NPDC007018 TaxID=3155721 RepID=UPI00340075B9